MSRPLPPTAPETDAWWEATRDRRLLVQRCRDCGNVQLYPRPLCLRCHGDALDLVEASGRGQVHSFSIVHRSPDPVAFPTPYAVALVRLDEGPLLTTNLVGTDLAAIRCDLAVQLRWEPLADGRNLPLFAPTDPER